MQDAINQQQPEAILAPAHLLAILLAEDKQRGSATAFVRNVHEEGMQASNSMMFLTVSFMPVSLEAIC